MRTTVEAISDLSLTPSDEAAPPAAMPAPMVALDPQTTARLDVAVGTYLDAMLAADPRSESFKKQGLVNQRPLLEQIGALNDTTADMIEGTSAMLRQQSATVYQQAASATVSIEKLQAAFANIYATIDASKLQALETMR